MYHNQGEVTGGEPDGPVWRRCRDTTAHRSLPRADQQNKALGEQVESQKVTELSGPLITLHSDHLFFL
jgi:hypothetical protein